MMTSPGKNLFQNRVAVAWKEWGVSGVDRSNRDIGSCKGSRFGEVGDIGIEGGMGEMSWQPRPWCSCRAWWRKSCLKNHCCCCREKG